MSLELHSPCKVNLLLNIFGRRPDGFHELETVMQPLGLHDALTLESLGSGVQLTCSDPALPVDGTNLVHKAATRFLEAAGIREGVRIHLRKRLPVAAGLGGGSANAATTLRGLNRLFDEPLDPASLGHLATELGSDVPFFLQDGPALCTGRGEKIEPLDAFPALRDRAVLLIRPGFGVSTGWAYQALARQPGGAHGRRGRAAELIQLLRGSNLEAAAGAFFNSLEAPVFHKYPLLALLKEALLKQGARVALMSGSGSTTFAVADSVADAEALRAHVLSRFGTNGWSGVVTL